MKVKKKSIIDWVKSVYKWRLQYPYPVTAFRIIMPQKKKWHWTNFYCKKYRNITQFPGVDILWKGTVFTQFWALWKLCFSNFHTRKLGEITVAFFAVNGPICVTKKTVNYRRHLDMWGLIFYFSSCQPAITCTTSTIKTQERRLFWCLYC